MCRSTLLIIAFSYLLVFLLIIFWQAADISEEQSLGADARGDDGCGDDDERG
jgi:hypothetical protein